MQVGVQNQEDADGKIERNKARLMVKGYNQKEEIDYNETFSRVSTKDARRVIMVLDEFACTFWS